MMLVAPVMLEHGSDDLRERYIRRTVTGEVTWCQLFSEPGAGSDLAGLQSRAVRDGQAWRLTGQKVWSTGAATADFGLLLARTDWDVPKHQGITAFVLPMRQPGVTVRPLRQMNGHSSFNEVFFDDASRGRRDRRAGRRLDGREGHARARAAARGVSAVPKADGRAWREAAQERTAVTEPHKWYPQRAGRPDLVDPAGAGAGQGGRPGRAAGDREADRAEPGRPGGWPNAPAPHGPRPAPWPGGLARQAGQQQDRQAGRPGALDDRGHVRAARPGPTRCSAGSSRRSRSRCPRISIAGGTDEIQRSIIAERILGLPREPDVSVGIPFRDVRVSRA